MIDVYFFHFNMKVKIRKGCITFVSCPMQQIGDFCFLKHFSLTFHCHGDTIWACDIVKFLICPTLVHKYFSAWYLFYPCSFLVETDLSFILKQQIVINRWIGNWWVASEIHPNVNTATVLCCVPFQGDILRPNWKNEYGKSP